MTLAAKTVLQWLLLGALLALGGCSSDPEPVQLSGGVFGTTWSLVYVPSEDALSPEAVESAVIAAFNVVNQQMNNYDPESDISRFNQLAVGETMEVGWDFAYVLGEALRITELTSGAYDTTVSPLSGIWGFGPDGPTTVPSAEAVQAALSVIGPDQLVWDSTERLLAKRSDGVSLDFSSIAKGYGVDLGADALDELGVTQYMLEVGGEVRLRGLSPRGDRWRIAIEKPDAEVRGVQAAVVATDTGIATSGDYRNFFEVDGVRYSHLIDPRNGQPIRHELVSVTVVHPSTALADAWATALIVVGYEEARALADQLELAVYFVRREGETFRVEWTNPMTAFLPDASS